MIGETVGNFVVVGQLGKGGMGEVLLAEHREIKTKVAIKVLLPQISAEKEHVQRFFNEAVAVSKIKHAGIAKIFDVGFHTKGEAYLVMEFLEGESLAGRISRLGQLPYEQVFDIARQIASVLEATHAAGITHRDLKPDNIFLVPDAELASGERVKVLDFGIAKLGASNMTQTSGAMGTPTYMSPEQWKSSAKVDGRADVYSLGCIAFEMACGRPPFVGESVGVLCALHLTEDAPRVSSLIADAPPPFDDLVAQLLSKQPQERMSANEAKLAFSQLASTQGAPGGPTTGHVPVKRWDTPTEGIVASAKPTTLGGSAMQIAVAPPPARTRPKWMIAVGVGMVAAAGVAFAITLKARRGASADNAPAPAPAPVATAAPAPAPAMTPPAPAAPAAEATSRLRIETIPTTAEVLIDHGAVSNPFDGKFPVSDARHLVEVRAPGYKPDTRWVVFDSEHTLAITLDKEDVAAVPASATTPAVKTVAKSASSPATKQTKPTTTKTAATSTPTATQAVTATETKPQTTTPAQTPSTTTPDAGKATYRGSKATISTQFPTE